MMILNEHIEETFRSTFVVITWPIISRPKRWAYRETEALIFRVMKAILQGENSA